MTNLGVLIILVFLLVASNAYTVWYCMRITNISLSRVFAVANITTLMNEEMTNIVQQIIERVEEKLEEDSAENSSKNSTESEYITKYPVHIPDLPRFVYKKEVINPKINSRYSPRIYGPRRRINKRGK